MKKICAWCNQVMVDGKGDVSHGICEECAQYVRDSVKKLISDEQFAEDCIRRRGARLKARIWTNIKEGQNGN